MPRKTLRTIDELKGILNRGGLDLAETFQPDKSYPKNYWVFTRCQKCGIEAHYRIAYILSQASIGEPVCRACHWKKWLRDYRALSPLSFAMHSRPCCDEDSTRKYVAKYGYDLVDVIVPGSTGEAVLLVKCQKCGKQSVERDGDIGFKCSCQRHTSTNRYYTPPVKRPVEKPVETHPHKVTMSIDEAKRTPVAAVPELLSAWDDDRDPQTTMIYPAGWLGMCPGDGQYRFKCANGHHPYAFPYTYLESGCPACRGLATMGTGLFLADTAPELAAEWVQAKNGKWTPNNVRDNSKRTVWWKCLACNHEWEATPRSRMKGDGQLCPHCGKIQNSIAWVYPRLASEWDSENPAPAWNVRPHTKLSFTPLWDCPQNSNHKYRAQISTRINGGECPECVESGKSRIEMEYFDAFHKKYSDARSGARYENPVFSNTWSIDISFRLNGRIAAVEYDGSYWHVDKPDVDERKSKELLAAGFRLVRIREYDLKPLSIDSDYYAELYVNPSKPDVQGTTERAISQLNSMP